MRIYLKMRWLSLVLLLIYLGFRVNSQPTVLTELILFNLVSLIQVGLILTTRIPDDRLARRVTALAISIWSIGSILSSIDSFFTTDFSLISQSCYLLFYPAIFFGLNRALISESRSTRIELIDTATLAIGGSTLLALFLIHPLSASMDGSALEIFLSIIYPVADLVLLLYVTIQVLRNGFSQRNAYILIGTLIYAGADFYYLWQTSFDTYVFGSLTDSLWLISFIFIGWSFNFPADERRVENSFNPAIAIVTAFASGIIIVVTVFYPDYFPRFAIAPAVAILSLAFARLTFSISDAKRISDELILARTDELTGLANRRKFLIELEEFAHMDGSLLILDLDGFKPVNDNLGHESGDQLLRQVAKRFERTLPHGALLARLGGDEFGVLVPGDEGYEVALALRATLSYPFHLDDHEIRLDVSIGVAANNPGQPTPLLRRADEAMYQAKRTKSGVLLWSESIMRHTS
ncbi:MAG: GGDEF domain-containing protein [Actinobacteria bacterium]|nr:GGDEF domain-containing protein [Actinomycetota bacterium]